MNIKAKNFLKECRMPAPLESLNSVIQGLLNNPNTPMAKLTKIVSMDPVLSAKIHKLANVTSNRGKTESGSLTKAITKLGLGKIRAQLQEQTEFISFTSELNEVLTPDDFRKRSLAVGLCAQIIDQSLEKNSDEIFYAGLLHDYGRLIILNNADKLPVIKLNKMCRDKKALVYKNERKVYGFNHMELADALFTEWRLPAVIREPAAFHHSPILAIQHKYETAVVHVADIICRSLNLGKSMDAYIPVLDMKAVKLLKLSQDQLDYICEETVHELEDYMKLLLHVQAAS